MYSPNSDFCENFQQEEQDKIFARALERMKSNPCVLSDLSTEDLTFDKLLGPIDSHEEAIFDTDDSWEEKSCPSDPDTPLSHSSSAWSPIQSSPSGEDDLSEAMECDKINAVLAPKAELHVQSKSEESPLVSAPFCAILNTFYCQYHQQIEYFLPPAINAAPFIAAPVVKSVKPRVKSVKSVKPRVIKAKKSDAESAPKTRVTVEQAFEQYLADRKTAQGKYVFATAEREFVAEEIFKLQKKISHAGRKFESERPTQRTKYTKLHDAMKKAQWTRVVVGDSYQYSK